MTAAVATLVVGITLGYLGQRSRLCFIGGVRDYILVRDTFLLKGLIAFGLTAWVAFPVIGLLAGSPSAISGTPDALTGVLTVIGGAGVGFLSTLANGCPFRQHVLAAQGAIDSMIYLAGFFAGAVIFHALTGRLLLHLLP